MASSITGAGRELGIKLGNILEDELGLEVVGGDSVLGKSKIWIKENNKIKEVNIEDVFKKCNREGLNGKEYYIPNRKIETLTLTQNGEMKWNVV